MSTLCSQRFDDIARSERYFTATLLPTILLNDEPCGLDAFLELVSRKALSPGGQAMERDRSGIAGPRSDHAATWSPDAVELITEFHIARDLKFARRLGTGGPVPPSNSVAETVTLDAPDLVIVLDDELVVCEGKFFGDYTLAALNEQLQSQRRQVRHLFEDRPRLRAYRHVAILPVESSTPPDCDAVITWGEITELSAVVLGPEHYVTLRLRAAVEHWERVCRGKGRNYNDFSGLEELLARCKTEGDRVHVGFVGGEQALQERPLTYLERRRWRWRYPATNRGRVVSRNWIEGARFEELINDRRRQNPERTQGLVASSV